MKRLLIIIALILVVIAIALFVWGYFQKTGSNGTQENQLEQSQNIYIPSLLGTAENLEVNDPQNKQQINEGFDNFINMASFRKISDSKDFAEFSYRSENGQPVALSDFADAIGIAIYPGVRKYLDQGNFTTIYCLDEGQKSYGLILNVGRFGKNVSVDYAEVELEMRNWEKKMLFDLRSLLFPGMSFSEVQLNQKLNFASGKYRFAEFALPDGSRGSINYEVFGDPIVITTSRECLDKVENYFISLD